jgi:3-hydroxyisobutyrate dehydrogenase-like beta-hydroxyacid dehydrogenase
LIGVGLLGSAIAERLLERGFGVLGYDCVPRQRESLAAKGGRAASSAAEVVRLCERIVFSLPDSDVVTQVLAEVEGALRQDQVLIDTTTGAPTLAAKTGRRLAEQGVAYLDAAVCGNSNELRRGEVLVVAGGPAAAYESCREIFAAFARASWRMGDWGMGLKTKLTTNLVLGLNRAVLAEALGFAEAIGLDRERVLAVLQESSSYSRVMDLKGRKMLTGDYEPQARLSQHLKDVRLMLEAGGEADARLPLTALHRQLLEQAEAAGLGGADNSAIAEVFRRK